MSFWNKPIERRTLLTAGGLATATLGLAAADALWLEPHWLEVSHHRIGVAELPSHLEGYRLAQVSDVHLVEIDSLHDKLCAALDAYSPQLVALTGDLLDDRSSLADVDALCARMTAPGRQVVAVLGNWEHWSGVSVERIGQLYQRHGIRLFINEHALLADGVLVAGTDDGSTHRADFEKACAHLPDTDLRMLLSHAPGVLELYPAGLPRFDLTLAGHTHGGQINIGTYAPLCPPGSGHFIAGTYETEAGTTYVCRGIGTSLFPVRLMCRPELALFEFHSA